MRTLAAGRALTVAELRSTLDCAADTVPVAVEATMWGHTQALAVEVQSGQLVLHVDVCSSSDFHTPMSWGAPRAASAAALAEHTGADKWAMAVLVDSLEQRAGATDTYAVVLGLLEDLRDCGYRLERRAAGAKAAAAFESVPGETLAGRQGPRDGAKSPQRDIA